VACVPRSVEIDFVALPTCSFQHMRILDDVFGDGLFVTENICIVHYRYL
jgi:hypothetical protein